MSFWTLPWLEFALLLPLTGALWVSQFRNQTIAFRWALFFTASELICTLLAGASLYFPGNFPGKWNLQDSLFGRQIFRVDQLNAPLLTLVALLHFCTCLATAPTKMGRFSVTSSLAAESLRIGMFSSQETWVLVALITVGTLPPYIQLVNRSKPTRVYSIHMILFLGLLLVGCAFANPDGDRREQTAWATIPLMAAVMVRCGTFPTHIWITDWFEHASFGNGLLFVAPLPGVYVAIKLVLPNSPTWVLESISLLSMITAVYSAAMATIQKDSRRFFAYLFVAHASLVLVGLELHTSTSLTGALCLWISAAISLGGFGLTLRALEARFGRLSLGEFHGLYEHTPTLAVCFLVTGLASVGFPGTSGFVAAEMLVDGAVDKNIWVGVVLIATAALNGIAVVRAYFIIFTGKRHTSTVSVKLGTRERIAIITIVCLIIAGGLFPQPGVVSRHHAAEQILEARNERLPRD
jgi:NADH-quinone oxidoreductase subunit M